MVRTRTPSSYGLHAGGGADEHVLLCVHMSGLIFLTQFLVGLGYWAGHQTRIPVALDVRSLVAASLGVGVFDVQVAGMCPLTSHRCRDAHPYAAIRTSTSTRHHNCPQCSPQAYPAITVAQAVAGCFVKAQPLLDSWVLSSILWPVVQRAKALQACGDPRELLQGQGEEEVSSVWLRHSVRSSSCVFQVWLSGRVVVMSLACHVWLWDGSPYTLCADNGFTAQHRCMTYMYILFWIRR